MFDHLRDSIRNTLNHVDGWITGRTFIENGKGFLEIDNGENMQLSSSDTIEILNGDSYVRITLNDLLEKKTPEGWPLFAGFDARVK